ncbi:hypothetical protein D3C87_2004820 [compost metagenome]
MSLARKPSRDLFRNQLGLNLGQQRAALREGQAQIRKTTVTALDHCQNALTGMANIAALVRQPGFDDQPHGLLPPLRYRSA